MSLQRIRSRIGAVICSLALLAIGVVVGLAANQASAATSSAAAVNSGGVVMLAPPRRGLPSADHADALLRARDRVFRGDRYMRRPVRSGRCDPQHYRGSAVVFLLRRWLRHGVPG